MNRRTFAAALLVGASAGAALAATPSPPATWDNLVKVESKSLQAVYLAPGADFRRYSQVQLDPTEVAFAKTWQRDINDAAIGLDGRISDEDAQKIAGQVCSGFGSIFAKAYADAGYPVAAKPGRNVLRIRTAVANLYIEAPDRNRMGRSDVYTVQAGEATLVVEARDSLTGALLGRAADNRVAGDVRGLRTSVSNRADFGDLFRRWAKASSQGLTALKAAAPPP